MILKRKKKFSSSSNKQMVNSETNSQPSSVHQRYTRIFDTWCFIITAPKKIIYTHEYSSRFFLFHLNEFFFWIGNWRFVFFFKNQKIKRSSPTQWDTKRKWLNQWMFSSVQPVVSSLIPSCFFSADSDKEIAVVCIQASKPAINQPTGKLLSVLLLLLLLLLMLLIIIIIIMDDTRPTNRWIKQLTPSSSSREIKREQMIIATTMIVMKITWLVRCCFQA